MKTRWLVNVRQTGLLEVFYRIDHARAIESIGGWDWEIDEEDIKTQKLKGRAI